MRVVGDAYREAGVAAIYLAHGTFVGPDALGILEEVGRVYPAASRTIRRITKRMVDGMTGDAGNYTEAFAGRFQQAMHRDGEAEIPVRLFYWSSQNNHVGRADGAVRMLDELDSLDVPAGSRVLLWGHSHAGNLFALMTNLLAADVPTVEQFFDAARLHYRWPWFGCVDVPVWRRVQKRLVRQPKPTGGTKLDIVTFGTPIRYGWDSAGYSRLLHFVNHRPVEGTADHLAPFPPTVERVLAATDGDYIQQLGIAGTNIMPTPLAWRSWLADRRLGQLLQRGVDQQPLIERLRLGARVPDEGTTLLVDYGPPEGTIARHLAGHAVYTQENWLLLHAEEVARRFYDQPPADGAEPDSN